MAYLYRHIRLDTNEVFYIGVGGLSKQDPTYKRARSKYRSNRIWKSITSKTDYKVEIVLDNISPEKALEEEAVFIKLHGRIDLNNGSLANLTNGGEKNPGWKAPIEFSLNQSKRVKGKGNPMYGRTHTQETRDKIRESKKQLPVNMDVINKLAEINRGKKRSEETKALMRKNAKRVAVIQSDMEGNFIKEWDSITYASYEGFSIGKICNCCKGLRKSHGGFKWAYKQESNF
jgi:hypothetical protein